MSDACGSPASVTTAEVGCKNRNGVHNMVFFQQKMVLDKHNMVKWLKRRHHKNLKLFFFENSFKNGRKIR